MIKVTKKRIGWACFSTFLLSISFALYYGFCLTLFWLLNIRNPPYNLVLLVSGILFTLNLVMLIFKKKKELKKILVFFFLTPPNKPNKPKSS